MATITTTLIDLAKRLVDAAMLEESVCLYEQVALLAPQGYDFFYQLGWLSMDAGLSRQAIQHFSAAIEIDSSRAEAYIYRGRAYLKTGDYYNGTRGLDWIYKGRGIESQIGLFVDEKGNKTDLTGKVVSVISDAGLGDAIQFVRYANLLKKQGATVVVECQPELVRLFSYYSEIDMAFSKGSASYKTDFIVPMHYLMGAFSTRLETIPCPIPYAFCLNEERMDFKRRLDAFDGFKVGIAWAGNPAQREDYRRSISGDFLINSLTTIPGIQLVSLQRGEACNNEKVIDWTDSFSDVAVTAALIENLDLIISVDSMVAHLAGALGRPVWLLNRYDSCWRWLESRDDSPWYPSLRQFRQTKAGDWDHVIDQVVLALKCLMEKTQATTSIK